MVEESPTVIVRAFIVPCAIGARFPMINNVDTLTEKVCVAVSEPSFAVTVTVALPLPSGEILILEPPNISTVATSVLFDVAL